MNHRTCDSVVQTLNTPGFFFTLTRDKLSITFYRKLWPGGLRHCLLMVHEICILLQHICYVPSFINCLYCRHFIVQVKWIQDISEKRDIGLWNPFSEWFQASQVYKNVPLKLYVNITTINAHIKFGTLWDYYMGLYRVFQIVYTIFRALPVIDLTK